MCVCDYWGWGGVGGWSVGGGVVDDGDVSARVGGGARGTGRGEKGVVCGVYVGGECGEFDECDERENVGED